MNVKFVYESIAGNGTKLPYEEFRRQFNRILKGYPLLETVQQFNACHYAMSTDEIIFHSLDILCATYGVETLYPVDTKNGQYIEYLNTGDPYNPTIVHCSAWKYPYRIAFNGYEQYVK